MHSAFSPNQYLLKRQVFALTGVFRIYDRLSGRLVLFSQQKMFKLREDIRVFSDEERSQEVLHINARNIIDFSAAFDVYDSGYGSLIGTLRRKGMRSILRDEWEICNPAGEVIGSLLEDSQMHALMRRLFAGILFPQNYDLICNGVRLVDLKQRFNLFRYELDIDILENSGFVFDRRLAIAAGILMAAIEGKQD